MISIARPALAAALLALCTSSASAEEAATHPGRDARGEAPGRMPPAGMAAPGGGMPHGGMGMPPGHGRGFGHGSMGMPGKPEWAPGPPAKPAEANADLAFREAIDLDPLARVVVQADGRYKPLFSLAREGVFDLTGRRRLQGEAPLYTILTLLFEPDRFADRKVYTVRYEDLTLAIAGRRAKTKVSQRELATNENFLRLRQAVLFAEGERKAPLGRAMMMLEARLSLPRRMPGRIRVIPSDREDAPWMTPTQLPARHPVAAAYKEMRRAFRARDAAAFQSASLSFATTVRGLAASASPPAWRINLEIDYFRYRPFFFAFLCFVVAALAMVLSRFCQRARARTVGLSAMAAGLALMIVGLIVRGVLMGTLPVVSFYDTLVCTVFVTAAVTLAYEARGGGGPVGFWGALLCAFALSVGEYQSQYMRHQGIDVLMPVLRSYWLHLHVTTVLVSYGAFLLAFGLSVESLVIRLGRGDPGGARQQQLDATIYRVVKLGFLFLTIGIVLGAVWARQSWGRYWGWDPKETWSLVTWLIYGSYLHARFAGMGRGIYGVIWNIVGFAAVMFTYIGVSFLLPGLHSYLT